MVTTQYNVIEDHNITLSCNVSGVPDVYDVSWTMDTTSGSVNSDRLTGGTITDPSLTVGDTELGDTGWYTCSATNLAGTTRGKPLHLNVTESKILSYVCLFVCLMMFNATFYDISVISWRSVLLLEESGGTGENNDLSQVTDKRYHIMLCTSP